MELKKPLYLSEQIARLKKENMIIVDDNRAEEILREINYYRFTGYALQFRMVPSRSQYCHGTKFDDVYKIYQFDVELRSLLRAYIERAEVFYRTLIAYKFSVAKCMTSPHNQHYDEKNYYYKKGFKEVMENFNREREYHKDSLIVQHHKAKYKSQMPLWVMVELMSFSNLSKLYSCMYISEQDCIANEVRTGAVTLANHLHCMSVLRNRCAHAGRLYNSKFNPPAKFTTRFYQKHKDIKNNSLFAYILILIRRLPSKKYSLSLINDVMQLLKKYNRDVDMSCMGFPDGYEDIMKESLY